MVYVYIYLIPTVYICLYSCTLGSLQQVQYAKSPTCGIPAVLATQGHKEGPIVE